MSKQIDFAARRRLQGRTLTASLREVADLISPFAEQSGVNLQARLAEGLAHRAESQRMLAQRLQRSVLPLFIAGNREPQRIGTCVLVHLDSQFFAFTAAHVIRKADNAQFFAPSGATGGKLVPLPPYTAHLSPLGGSDDVDVAVLTLSSNQLGCFTNYSFLIGSEIDQNDQPDDEAHSSFYFALGYSASRSQVKINRMSRRINQKSFHCSTGPISAAEYVQERLSQADYIALDYDHGELVHKGARVNPPKLQGISGGGFFHISRETLQGPLVAIATQNRRRSRLIMGTRIKHFLRIARELSS